jgi:hypothetical protein
VREGRQLQAGGRCGMKWAASVSHVVAAAPGLSIGRRLLVAAGAVAGILFLYAWIAFSVLFGDGKPSGSGGGGAW